MSKATINFNPMENQVVIGYGDVLSTMNGKLYMVVKDEGKVRLMNLATAEMATSLSYDNMELLETDVRNCCVILGSRVKQVIPSEKLIIDLKR